MNYVNDRFYELMNSVEENRQIVEAMKKDVDEFMPEFHDSPDRLSRWGHYYFCDDDGGRLIFDLNSPSEHKCQVCGKVFKSDIFDGVWVYFYRNRAVVMALVSAFIYKATKEKKYFDYAVKVLDFYGTHYQEFVLHNKENKICDSYDTMAWGCGRMMPQGLNESIVAIRFVQTIEILREELDSQWLDMLYHNMFREMFHLLAPQVEAIHNISCWDLCAIGVMGLAFHDQEMIDFAFQSPFNVRQQMKKGVTKDRFWYEGSTHYNFFLLEGVSYLFLFCRLYDYDFGEHETKIFEEMFVQAYYYAFDSLDLPNPNDGWPNLNLRTFSYIYHTVARALGESSQVANITKIIEKTAGERTILPLSEPYYCQNRVCLEQLLFNIDFDYDRIVPVERGSRNFPESNYVILRNKNWNAFMKYGLHGASHAHPDIMNVELMLGNYRVSRDLSNAGYRARLCNEWHRKTLSHNTVCCNGTDITSVNPGQCLAYDGRKITARADNVYEGVSYCRTIEITENAFEDLFEVTGCSGQVYDYVFHFESEISFEHQLKLMDGDLGFRDNGYQHVLETKRVTDAAGRAVVQGKLHEKRLQISVNLADGQEMYLLKTMDNPVNKTRNTILLRSREENPVFRLRIEVQE